MRTLTNESGWATETWSHSHHLAMFQKRSFFERTQTTLIDADTNPVSKTKRLLNVSGDVATITIRCEGESCEGENWQNGLKPAIRCAMSTAQRGRL